jgi:DNA-binding LytR/AlgR family response regulator
MNCIIIDDDAIIQRQLASFINKSDLLNLKGTFANPVEAIQTIKQERIDVVFLDIEMPEMSGLEFLDEAKFDVNIIVISGDRKYALDTFEYDVTDYLLKPIEYRRFLKAVNKAVERNFEKDNVRHLDSLFFKSKGNYVRLKLKDIVTIQSHLDQKLLNTYTKTFTILDSDFNPDNICLNSNFFKINDEYIVNLDEISEICNNYLIFKHSDNFANIQIDEDIAVKISEKMNI